MEIPILYAYEYLLRNIYGYKDKSFNHGADSDVYKRLMEAGDNSNKFNFELGKIYTYLTEALRFANEQHSTNEEFVKSNKVIINKLDDMDEPDKSIIDGCISEAYDIFETLIRGKQS